MANLTPESGWDDIYQLETTDPVLGGAGGISNRQAQELLNRTEWLKERIGRWMLADFTANKSTVSDSDVGLLTLIVADANKTVTIDPIASFTTTPCVLHFSFFCAQGKSITLQTSGEPIRVGNWNGFETRTKLYFKDGEFLRLLMTGSAFEIIDVSPGIYEVGDCLDGYASRRNTAVRQGTLLNRADEPRLWEWVQSTLTDGHELVDDSTWNSSTNVSRNGVNVTVNPYKGCFSKGNGSSTFRLPDDRAMFTRYLDLGRGLDLSRIHNYAGGFELDQILSHDHPFTLKGNGEGEGGISAHDSPTNVYKNDKTGATGGTENLVKNTGKVPLIKL